MGWLGDIATFVVPGGALVKGAETAVGEINKGNEQAAAAMEKAGQAQLEAAQKRIDFEREALDKSLAERRRVEERGVALAQQYASLSAGEIASINRVLSQKEKALKTSFAAIEKQQAVLDAMDPVVKESGAQTLALLRGETAKVLEPMMKAREKQRTALENDLASRLGPGFRTSSAGIEALMKFDEGTSLVFSQAQQEALTRTASIFGNFFNQQYAGQSDITRQTGDALSRELMADTSVLQAEQFARNRLAGAVMSGFRQTPVDFSGPAQAQGQVAAVSGAPYAGDIFRGQSNAAMWGSVLNAGVSLAGAGIGGAMGSTAHAPIPAPTPAPAPSATFGSVQTQPMRYNSQYFGDIYG